MPTGIQQLGRKNSDGAVICGKRFVELSHSPADAWEPLHHVHLDSHFGHIQGSLNAGDPSADNQYIFAHDSPLLSGHA